MTDRKSSKRNELSPLGERMINKDDAVHRRMYIIFYSLLFYREVRLARGI